jgi:hypothetical protein
VVIQSLKLNIDPLNLNDGVNQIALVAKTDAFKSKDVFLEITLCGSEVIT